MITGCFGGLHDGGKSDEWEDGGRDAVGVKTLRGGQRSTHHTAHVILTETNAGRSEVMLCLNVNSEAGRNIRGNCCNKNVLIHRFISFFLSTVCQF